MQIQDWGEEGFIRYLKDSFPGIGDDCAVIPTLDGMAWLVTTDALVEGVHFLKEQISAQDLGYKTVAVNVSDIGAMGGEPKFAFLSIALPKETDSEWLRGVIAGIKGACQKWGILLSGGDTVGSKRDLFLNLTLIGTMPLSKVKYRHTARVGDIVCVSGCLGDSAGGLKALEQGIESDFLIRAHFHPIIPLEQGIYLGTQEGVHAMMDLSDGLDCDLKRLLRSSQKGAIIDLARIPISEELMKVSLENSWDFLNLALMGGEDYGLLFTLSPEVLENLPFPCYPIGEIVIGEGEIFYEKDGRRVVIEGSNFNHFT